jgi:predicted nucleic acid-binding protein
LIAVDSSVWIDWIRRNDGDATEKLRRILNKEDIAVGDVVLLEILQGARDDLHASKIERMLGDCVPVEMLSRSLAVIAAANFRTLRGKGVTIRKAPDIIIGTWCIENNCPLLHSDRDFAPLVEHLGLRES